MRIAQLLQQGFQQYAEPVMLFLKVVHDDEDCPDDCLKAAAGVLGYAPSQSGTRVEACKTHCDLSAGILHTSSARWSSTIWVNRS